MLLRNEVVSQPAMVCPTLQLHDTIPQPHSELAGSAGSLQPHSTGPIGIATLCSSPATGSIAPSWSCRISPTKNCGSLAKLLDQLFKLAYEANLYSSQVFFTYLGKVCQRVDIRPVSFRQKPDQLDMQLTGFFDDGLVRVVPCVVGFVLDTPRHDSGVGAKSKLLMTPGKLKFSVPINGKPRKSLGMSPSGMQVELSSVASIGTVTEARSPSARMYCRSSSGSHAHLLRP